MEINFFFDLNHRFDKNELHFVNFYLHLFLRRRRLDV